MNKTKGIIKAKINGTPEDIFEVVNAYVLTTLSLRTSDGKAVMSMHINKFEKYDNTYEFSQKCTGFNDVMYQLNTEDIVSVDAEYNKEANAFYVTCKLKNDMELWLMIVNASNSESELDDFSEMDVFELQDFLERVIHDKNKYYCISARITDVFGFDAKLNPKRVYINTLDEDDWKLHISDDFNTFEVPVVDDCINEFWIKKTDTSKQIIVKPYNQPFMEISMLFFEKHE